MFVCISVVLCSDVVGRDVSVMRGFFVSFFCSCVLNMYF